MTKKLLLSGYFGFDNSGDDAILKAMVDNLKKTDEDFIITALSKDPEKTKKNYEIDSLDRFSFNEVFKAMKTTDCFVFGGGSLLQDITSSRSLYYYLALLSLANFFKKQVFVFANGIGPIDSKFNRWITRRVLNKVDFITLRDKSSVMFTKYIGVTNENLKMTADPVFLLDSSSDERANKILESQGIQLGENVLGVSIRNWHNSPNLTREIAKFCDSLVDDDIDILIVPMHYPYDVEYSETIKLISKNKRIHLLQNKYEVEDIIAILRKCKMVLAMRLHALIYSAKANVPIVGLIYDPKVTGLIEELSVTEYLRVEELTAEDLRLKYDYCMENIDDRKVSITLANKRQETLAKETLDLLEERLRIHG
jgi:polysaccharide pyruvyl transferase CsaB